MAYISKHGDKWRAQVAIKGIRRSAVWPTKREAEAWGKRTELEIDAGNVIRADRTFEAATVHYLATVSPDKADGAAKWERRRFDAMLEFFGEVPIGEIDSERIGKWRDYRLKTVSGSTVQREANLLRNLFMLACNEWRWIQTSPFRGVRLPKENQARHQLWRWQEIKRVIRAGQRAGEKTGEVALAFHIALRTGMRLSEVLNSPGNLKGRVVTIKTKTEPRAQIPVNRIAAELIARAKFTVGPNEASALFSRLTRQQMVEGVTFHDARATALTLLARKHDVMVLARISRHKDISLLHRVYYRETAEDIAARL